MSMSHFQPPRTKFKRSSGLHICGDETNSRKCEVYFFTSRIASRRMYFEQHLSVATSLAKHYAHSEPEISSQSSSADKTTPPAANETLG